MSPLRVTLPCAMLLLTLGCTRDVGPAPTLEGVAPQTAAPNLPVRLSVTGLNFSRRLEIDFARSDGATATGDFALRLVRGTSSTALDTVTFVDSTHLTGFVPPGLAEGKYRLELTDPWNRTAALEDAYEVNLAVCQGSCDDGDFCTVDTCEKGECRHEISEGLCDIDGVCYSDGRVDPTDPNSACRSCNPKLSRTSWSPRNEGRACDDGYACTTGDVCTAGRCQGTADAGCPNTPPLACLTATPTGAAQGDTVTLDATCASDLEDAPGGLQVRFDFTGDGSYTAFGTARSATYVYPGPGLYQPTVEVRDTGGLSAFATRTVSVASASDDLVVTTDVDEDDPGATPSAPGGFGLSLREAIKLANAGAGKVIRFARPMKALVRPALPDLIADGAIIVGGPGVAIDFASQPPRDAGVPACLTLRGANQRLIAVDARNCPGPGPLVQTLGAGGQLADSRLHLGRGLGVALGGTGTLGPRTEVSDFDGAGVQIQTADNTVDGARIHRNRVGVDEAATAAGNILIQRSELYDNGDGGITVAPGQSTVTVRFNTIDGNGGAGLAPANTGTAINARNNLFTRNRGAGLCGPAGAYTSRAPNGSFGNDGGTACQGTLAGVEGDPLYLAPSRGDFRLGPGSPMINQGLDTGVDVNGPAPGGFNGPFPDLGANEAP